MARRKEKRRVSKDQLALAVRKNFNAAAVSEIDVMVELVYKVRSQGKSEHCCEVWRKSQMLIDRVSDKAFRLRSTPNMPKKAP